MKHTHLFPALVATAVALTSCSTPSYETRAREDVAAVGDNLRPSGRDVGLPVLTATSPASDYLRFALLKHPQVEAAFHEWRATSRRSPPRAQPDPKLSFEADIAETVMTAMPGFMFDFMGRGKRDAMGREAAAASAVTYRNYVTAVLTTETAVRKAWVDLAYIDETSR
jgi:hypothetical protein